MLIIAEKPSLGKEIAKAISVKNKTHLNKLNGYYKVNNITITWCYGHLLEMKKPEDYNKGYEWGKWNIYDKLIIPNPFELKIAEQSSEQLYIIKSLINDADLIINAGDPDREGQLLVDEIIYYLNYNGPVKRLLINDVTESAILNSLNNIRDNHEFNCLYQSAIARQRADWLLGFNLSRLATTMARKQGVNETFHIGRVKTPTLALVVNRFLEIKNFKKSNYYEIVTTYKNLSFKLDTKYLFENGVIDSAFFNTTFNIIDKKYCLSIIKKINSRSFNLSNTEVKKLKQNAPMPFALKDLQVAANKAFSFTAKKTLSLAQSLYEKKAITYPRSDNNYLPNSFFNLDYVSNTSSNINLTFSIKLTNKHKCFNDEKVSAHHAIVPTTSKVKELNLSDNEYKLYELISRRFIALFYPAAEYAIFNPILKSEPFIFVSKEKKLTKAGYLKILKPNKSLGHIIPTVFDVCKNIKLNPNFTTKQTSPPKHFTEASLLSAMNNIAKYVTSKKLKSILRETNGIGTPSTQSSIIEDLKTGGYISLRGKNLVPSHKAIKLISLMPQILSTADLTALWELRLSAINDGKLSYDVFYKTMISQIKKIHQSFLKQFNVSSLAKNNNHKCPSCSKMSYKKVSKNLYACSSCNSKLYMGYLKKELSDSSVIKLLAGKRSNLMTFKNKKGEDFKAYVIINNSKKSLPNEFVPLKLVFPSKKNNKGKR